MRKFFLLGVFMILSHSLMQLPAATLSLDKDTCLSQALANNPDLLARSLSLKTSRRADDTSWNLYLPAFSTSLSGTISTRGVSISPEVSISYTFSGGLKEAIRQLKLKLASSEISYESARQQLIMNVEAEFYYLLTSRNNLEIQKSNIALAQKRVEQTEVKFKNGLVSDLDVLQDKVNLANLGPAYSSLKSAYENRTREFLAILGIDPLTEVELVGEIEVKDREFNRDKLIEHCLQNRADIKAQQNQLDILESSLHQTRGVGYTPSLSLAASWSGALQNNYTADFSFSDNLSASLRLNLKLDNYIPGSAADLKIKEIKDAIAQAQLTSEKLIRNARLEIINLVDSLATDRENLAISRLNLELAEKSYKMTEESFLRGISDRLVLDNAQQNLLKARQNLLESQYRYMKDMITLRGALGVESFDELETPGSN